MDYERNEEAPSSSVIDVNIPAPVDIATVWSADETVIELQLAGQLPQQDWTVDVTLNLSARLPTNFSKTPCFTRRFASNLSLGKSWSRPPGRRGIGEGVTGAAQFTHRHISGYSIPTPESYKTAAH